MNAQDPNSMRQVLIQFRTENERDMSELARAGWTALEQAETELESSGVSVSLEPSGGNGDEGARGFGPSDILVNVVADTITILLFRAATDLMHRWQRLRQRSAHSTQPEESRGCTLILHAGDQQMIINPDTPSDEVYHQLSLWSANVLEAGNVTFQMVDNPV